MKLLVLVHDMYCICLIQPLGHVVLTLHQKVHSSIVVVVVVVVVTVT